jgi:hypothetical protein
MSRSALATDGRRHDNLTRQPAIPQPCTRPTLTHITLCRKRQHCTPITPQTRNGSSTQDRRAVARTALQRAGLSLAGHERQFRLPCDSAQGCRSQRCTVGLGRPEMRYPSQLALSDLSDAEGVRGAAPRGGRASEGESSRRQPAQSSFALAVTSRAR